MGEVGGVYSLQPLAVAYLRVSTEEQDEEMQRATISEWCSKNGIVVLKWYIDKISGATPAFQRPALRQLLDEVPKMSPRPTFFITYDVTRVARSLQEFLNILNIIENKLGLIFIPVRDLHIYRVPSEYRPLFRTLLAMFSELERQFIRRRVRDTMREKKQQGKITNVIDDLKKTCPDVLNRICIDYELGLPIRKIAENYNLTLYTVRRVLYEYCGRAPPHLCPRCGSRLILEKRDVEVGDRPGHFKIKIVYYCKNCGYTKETEYTTTQTPQQNLSTPHVLGGAP